MVGVQEKPALSPLLLKNEIFELFSPYVIFLACTILLKSTLLVVNDGTNNLVIAKSRDACVLTEETYFSKNVVGLSGFSCTPKM
jgi:hypothetical protein